MLKNVFKCLWLPKKRMKPSYLTLQNLCFLIYNSTSYLQEGLPGLKKSPVHKSVIPRVWHILRFKHASFLPSSWLPATEANDQCHARWKWGKWQDQLASGKSAPNILAKSSRSLILYILCMVTHFKLMCRLHYTNTYMNFKVDTMFSAVNLKKRFNLLIKPHDL